VSLRLIAGLGCVLLAACGGRGPAESEPGSQVRPTLHTHPNGLQLRVNESVYRIARTEDGFVVEPASGNEHRRDPLTISIRLRPEPPDTAAVRTRRLAAGRIVRYSVSHDEEGGSGGVDYRLAAFERAGTSWIHYWQRKQSEYGEPSFELWKVAEGVRYVPAGTN
jgi:hypothetical protein